MTFLFIFELNYKLMRDNDKLVNAIIDMHQELALFRKESNERLGKVENRLVLINKAIGELRLSNMKLAQQMTKFSDYDKRLRKVETVLAKKNLL